MPPASKKVTAPPKSVAAPAPSFTPINGTGVLHRYPFKFVSGPSQHDEMVLDSDPDATASPPNPLVISKKGSGKGMVSDLMDIDTDATDATISSPAPQAPTSRRGKAKGKIPNPIVIPQEIAQSVHLAPNLVDASRHYGSNEVAVEKDTVHKKARQSVVATHSAALTANTKRGKNTDISAEDMAYLHAYGRTEYPTKDKGYKLVTTPSSPAKFTHKNHLSTQGPTNARGDTIVTSFVSPIKSIHDTSLKTGSSQLGLHFRTPTKTASTPTKSAPTLAVTVGATQGSIQPWTPESPFFPYPNTVIGASSHTPGTPRIGSFPPPLPRSARLPATASTSRAAHLLAFDEDHDEDEDEYLPPPPGQFGVDMHHHDSWSPKSVHTAKCDSCGIHNKSVIQRCNRCGQQFCRVCIVSLPEGHKHYKRDVGALKWDVKDTPAPRPRGRAKGVGPTAAPRVHAPATIASHASATAPRRASTAATRNSGSTIAARNTSVSGRGEVTAGSQAHQRRPSLDDVASGRVRKFVSSTKSTGKHGTNKMIGDEPAQRLLSEAARRYRFGGEPYLDLPGSLEESDDEEIIINTPHKGRSYKGEVIDVERETEFQRQLRLMKQGNYAPERENVPDHEKQFVSGRGVVYENANEHSAQAGYRAHNSDIHEALSSRHASQFSQNAEVEYATKAQWSGNLTPNPFKNVPNPYKLFAPGSSGPQTTMVDNEPFRGASGQHTRYSKGRAAMSPQLATGASVMRGLPGTRAPPIRPQGDEFGFTKYVLASRSQQYTRAFPGSDPSQQPWVLPADAQQQFNDAIAQAAKQRKEKQEIIKLREQRDLANKLYHYKERCDQAWASNEEIQGLLREGKFEAAHDMFASAKVLMALLWAIPAELIPADN